MRAGRQPVRRPYVVDVANSTKLTLVAFAAGVSQKSLRRRHGFTERSRRGWLCAVSGRDGGTYSQERSGACRLEAIGRGYLLLFWSVLREPSKPCGAGRFERLTLLCDTRAAHLPVRSLT